MNESINFWASFGLAGGARELAMAMVAGALARADLRALNVGLRAPPRRAWTAHALALGVSRCMGGLGLVMLRAPRSRSFHSIN